MRVIHTAQCVVLGASLALGLAGAGPAAASEPGTEVVIQVFADGKHIPGTQELLLENPAPSIADVAAVMNSAALTLQRGQSRQLTVMKSVDGEPFVDVTHHRQLMVMNSTPWRLRLDAGLVLSAAVDPEFTLEPTEVTGPIGGGVVEVIYLDEVHQKAGSSRIPVQVVE